MASPGMFLFPCFSLVYNLDYVRISQLPLLSRVPRFDLNADAYFAQGAFVWPGGLVPEEVFDEIIQYLQFSDVKNLRLVCQEFHQKTTANFVHTLATSFKPEFSLPAPGASNLLRGYGQNILIQQGHHVSRFSLCLEVDEDALSCPPIQPDQKLVQSYWGFHLWPNSEDERYSDLARLETAADNVEGITRALRLLVNVADMTISCDPGWGRLLGPERRHIAARILRDQYQVMGLPTIHDRAPSRNMPLPTAPRPFLENAERRRRLTLQKMIQDAGVTADDVDSVRQHIEDMDSHPGQTPTLSLKESQPGLTPIHLNMPQREFLMESEWASRALVQSWAIALGDISRSGGFRHLTCLRFAKISSSHLTIITSQTFWESVSNVDQVHLQVLPNWRRVTKDHSEGAITDQPVEPVEAGTEAFQLLQLISQQRNITTFHFEWLCGGELSWGSQRGRYILPAPFTRRPELMVNRDMINGPTDLVSFPHVVSLSLKNCWFTPHVFLGVMRHMAKGGLVNLKLESVSLSGAARRPPLPAQALRRHPLRRLLERYALARFPPLYPSFPSIGVPGTPNNPLHATLPWLTGFMPPLLQGVAVPNANINAGAVPLPFNIPDPPAAEVTDLVVLPFGWDLPVGLIPDAILEPGPAGQPQVVSIPRSSWPGIIDALSSGPKTTKVHDSYSDASEVPDRPGPTIPSMEFKSCGYVAIESFFVDTSRLGRWRSFADHYRWTTCELRIPESTSASHEDNTVAEPEPEHLENEIMQSSWSDLNGWVSPRLPCYETEILRDVFGMRMGWDGVYDAQTVALAKAVNPNEPGQGRFSGVISGEEKV